MANITADFETGTSGNSLSTSDTGSATAYNGVSIGASATLQYDTTHVHRGSKACKVATGASSVASYFYWEAAFTQTTEHYGRMYLYFTANPGSPCQPMAIRNTGDSIAVVLRLNTDGK